MPHFERADSEVNDLAKKILKKHDTHKPLLQMGVTIDYVMAYASVDSSGMPVGNALSHHGHRALGIAKIIPLKQRVLGRADGEISLDGDWWKEASPEQRESLLDHELHHFQCATDSKGSFVKDDVGRPKLRMRNHDYDFGWFTIIAARNGINSMECQQAKSIWDVAGQYLFPWAYTDRLTAGLKKELQNPATAAKFGKDVTISVVKNGKKETLLET